MPDDGAEAVLERHTEYCAEGTNVHGSHVYHVGMGRCHAQAARNQKSIPMDRLWRKSGEIFTKFVPFVRARAEDHRRLRQLPMLWFRVGFSRKMSSNYISTHM